MLFFDYETEAIDGNPSVNPPKPVGVAIKHDDGPSEYLAWGHPTNNNCSEEEGHGRLRAALLQHPEWCAQHAPFERAITERYLGLQPPASPTAFHDTKYLIYLVDPYAFSFSLKPAAERILGWAPEERDELRDWILSHVGEATPKTWGAYICRAPGDLVGRYACGDTDRTHGLYRHCMIKVTNDGMLAAYEREQRLMPTLVESSVRGVRVDVKKLEEDIRVYTAAKKAAEDYIHGLLGDFNLDSDREFADALDRAGQVTEWVLTPTGRRSTSRKNLAGRVRDPELLTAIAYRGVLATCLGTFAIPWLETALRTGGRVHPEWNQVRGDKGQDGDLSGTRTGRMSCRDPNLQNPPNDFDGLSIPACVLPILEAAYSRGWTGPAVMHMRRYLLPEPGHVWLKRDFSAQEMRIMAHFAEGKLYDAYRADPTIDPHEMVRVMLRDMLGIDLPRKFLKIIAFGIMYGRGVPNLSAALGVPESEGKRFRDAYYQLLPEVRELSNAVRRRGRSGSPIRTWGGRLYYREPNPERDLSYKLLNYLIQGSAADQTKQSIIDWREAAPADHMLIAAVHDEINISVPVGQEQEGMRILQAAMDMDRFDVPFRSEGYFGPNWSELQEWK